MAGDLFHAYVVGGARANARALISDLLTSHKVPQNAGPDYCVVECVNFTIDDARNLREWQGLSPQGEKKIHLIFADFITHEAQNALLKIFEEPTPATHMIFAVPKPDILLPTLLSRVQVLLPAKTSFSKDVFAGSSAPDFLKMSLSERVVFIGKIIEKSDSEEASAEVREKAVAFLETLERHFAERSVQNREQLEMILNFKKYLFMSGASVKMILETIALTI